MKIKVYQDATGEWRADPVDLPGTPPNGRGKCRWSAVGSLLFAIRHENDIWKKHNWPEVLIVDSDGKAFQSYPVKGIDAEVLS